MMRLGRITSRATQHRVVRRTSTVLGGVVVMAFSLAVSACGSSGGGGSNTLVVASFGGALDQGLAKAAADFEKQYHATVKFVPGTSVENVAKVVNSQPHPTTDVVFANDSSAYTGSLKHAWAPLDKSIVTNLSKLYPIAIPASGDHVGIGLNVAGIFYEPSVYKKNGWTPPTSYADLFKYLGDKNYCGKIGMEHPDVTVPLEAAFAAGKGNVPNGIDYLSGLKKCIPVLEPNSAKFEANMQSGQYVVGVYNSLHTVPLIQKGADLKFVYPTEGGMAAMTTVAQVKNAPHAKLAQQFINSMLTQSAQTVIVNQLAFGPVLKGIPVSQSLLADGVPDATVTAQLLKMPLDQFAQNQQKWSQLFISKFS